MKIVAALRLLTLAATALVLTPVVQADVPTVTFANPDGRSESVGADTTVGWGFPLSTTMTVTELGFHAFAPNSPGTAPSTSHEVAIWNASGQRIADGTAPAGTAGMYLNGTYYVSIAPVILTFGTYTIGAFVPNGSDSFDINDTVTPIRA